MDDENGNGTPRPIPLAKTAELPGPEATAATLDRLADSLAGAVGLARRAGRLAREGGFDAVTRGVLSELADHFDYLSAVASGAARAIRRLIS